MTTTGMTNTEDAVDKETVFTYVKLAFIAGAATGTMIAYFIAKRIEDRAAGQLFSDSKCPCCTGKVRPSDKRCPDCYVDLGGR